MTGARHQRTYRASNFRPVPNPDIRHFKRLSGVIALICVFMLWLVYDVVANSDAFEVKTSHFDTQGVLVSPLKIAFLSDLHIRNSTSQFAKLNSIINTVKESEPDVILLGGDYTGEDAMSTQIFREELLSGLSRLTGIAPTYAVLGNLCEAQLYYQHRQGVRA